MRLCGPNHAASGHEFVQSDKATDRKGTAALQEFVLLLTSKQGFFLGICVCVFVCLQGLQENGNLDQHRKFNG
jgi:hypothetical protein